MIKALKNGQYVDISAIKARYGNEYKDISKIYDNAGNIIFQKYDPIINGNFVEINTAHYDTASYYSFSYEACLQATNRTYGEPGTDVSFSSLTVYFPMTNSKTGELLKLSDFSGKTISMICNTEIYCSKMLPANSSGTFTATFALLKYSTPTTTNASYTLKSFGSMSNTSGARSIQRTYQFAVDDIRSTYKDYYLGFKLSRTSGTAATSSSSSSTITTLRHKVNNVILTIT